MDVVDHYNEPNILRVAPRRGEPVDPARGRDPLFRIYNGAMWFRRGAWEKAVAAWAPVEDDARNGAVVRTWTALALARAGRLDEALARLPKPTHLRGEVRCAMGDLAGGIEDIRASMGAKGREEWQAARLVHFLMLAGRPAEAGAYLDERLEWAARYGVELNTLALRAWLAAGEPAKAWPHVEKIAAYLPALAARLVMSDGFVGFEQAAEARKAAQARSTAWMPGPIRALLSASSGLDALTAEESEAVVKELPDGESAPMGVLPGPSMWEALEESRRYRPFAKVNVWPGRSTYVDLPAYLLYDPEAPERVYLCMSTRIPAFLWPSAPATPEGLAALLAPYPRGEVHPPEDPTLADLPGRWRLYLGQPENFPVPSPYSGQLEPLEFHTFARVAVSSPFLLAAGWGNKQVEDPYTTFVDRGGLDMAAALRANGEMDPHRMQAESYRLAHSRGVLTLYDGPAGLAIEVRYAPNPHPGSVEAINELFGTKFPVDLPLDAVGALMHFEPAADVAALQGLVGQDAPDEVRWPVYGLAMLLHDDPAFDAWLTTMGPAISRKAVPPAWSYGRLGWLLRLALTEPSVRGPLQNGPGEDALAPPEPDYADEDDEEEE